MWKSWPQPSGKQRMKVSVRWERENVDGGEADDPQPETNIKVKKGEKFKIQKTVTPRE